MKMFQYSIFILLLVLVSCVETQSTEEVSLPSEQGVTNDIDVPAQEAIVKDDAGNIVTPPKNVVVPEWFQTELKDVNSGESYTIHQFKGKPVLLESFAVWCPLCTRQQEEVKKLHDQIGEEIISISLNTDPNEDERIVQEHADTHGFTWRYSVAPREFTQALIDEFGIGVVNAPAVPVVLVCPDQSTHLLQRGIKSAATLQQEITRRC